MPIDTALLPTRQFEHHPIQVNGAVLQFLHTASGQQWRCFRKKDKLSAELYLAPPDRLLLALVI